MACRITDRLQCSCPARGGAKDSRARARAGAQDDCTADQAVAPTLSTAHAGFLPLSILGGAVRGEKVAEKRRFARGIFLEDLV